MDQAIETIILMIICFLKNNIEKNVINSIDGATALKLDENYEIKNSEEQNALIDSFENKEEKMIARRFCEQNLSR